MPKLTSRSVAFYNVAGKQDISNKSKIINVKSSNIIKNRYFAPLVARTLDEDVFAIDASCLNIDLVNELDKNKKAKKFFDTLGKNNLFAIYYRLHSAKTDKTRIRKMNEILDMLSNEKAFYKKL